MMYAINPQVDFGAMAELVDAPVLGTGLVRGEGSIPFRPTNSGHGGHVIYRNHEENVDKSVYEVVYDMTTLSTIVKKKGVVYKSKLLGSGLRKNYTFHLNNTSDYFLISSKCFFINNLINTSVVVLSTFVNIISRQSDVLSSIDGVFSQCPIR